MSVEWFLKLKEYDSLSKARINYLKTIKEQEDRLSKLNERRELSLTQTSTLNQSIREVESELFEVEKKLKTLSEQKQRFLDVGNSEKAESFQKDIDQAESKGLELLEKVEAYQTEIQETKTFSAGLEKTIHEIQTEVNLEKERLNKEIEQIDFRLEGIKEDLPEDFKTILSRTLAKNPAHGPFTRVENGSCFFCRYKISRVDESEIDMQRMLKTCPQCSRIFLPYGS